jgi:hypothetical protein
MDQKTPAVKLYLRLATMTRARIRLVDSLRSDTNVELSLRKYADSVRKCRQTLQEAVAALHGA